MTDQNVVVSDEVDDAIIEKLIIGGDLSKLSPMQKVTYYNSVCKSMGLNPLTRPFEYMKLQGKETLYPSRNGTDQLRKINGVNLEVVSQKVHDGLLTVHVRARDKTGRVDEDYGVVSIAGLRGEAASNAFMKAVTKGKRRATLSIVGLGWTDDSEIDSIAGAVREPFAHLGSDKPVQNVSDQMRELEEKEQAAEEQEPHEVERDDDSERAWSAWATKLLACIRAAKTPQSIDEWIVANSDSLEALKHYDTGKFNRLRHMIQAAQDAKPKAAVDDAG